ncbi:MAG: MoaD/ThiS family protein [Protaetiibacter sp.]
MARVRFFAAAEEAVGVDHQDRSETTLGELRAALLAAHPGLVGVLPRCAVLVDGVRADDAHPLGADTLVDVLPPFAGG